eukprot:TRINITY_DN34391_c0_g1_i1.p1 TRINITY_DN34391_c0_g1~~TRINITY_DN34391_c0_g1_i1.p1  ORF type:complete len:141 (+),score=37.82 TRINITY_DN34391_c0_g1_i1:102-524(+)
MCIRDRVENEEAEVEVQGTKEGKEAGGVSEIAHAFCVGGKKPEADRSAGVKAKSVSVMAKGFKKPTAGGLASVVASAKSQPAAPTIIRSAADAVAAVVKEGPRALEDILTQASAIFAEEGQQKREREVVALGDQAHQEVG